MIKISQPSFNFKSNESIEFTVLKVNNILLYNLSEIGWDKNL